MASVPFVIERRLHYHGIWNAGYNIGELFLKSISREFVTKPPFPAVLKLSIGSLALTVYQKGTSHPRAIRTDTIPFGALRDIAVNAFNNRCLMVIYVNNKNKFSVLVTSCHDAKEATDVTAAFKRLNAIAQTKKLQGEPNNANWIMRKNVSSNSLTTSSTNNNHISSEEHTSTTGITDVRNTNENTNTNNVNGEPEANGHPSTSSSDSDASSMKSRTDSSVLNENFDFLKEHEESLEEDSIFNDDVVICDREKGPGENSFSVGLQVDLKDRSDMISLSSESSFVSFQSIKDEIDYVTPSSAIAEEEYSKKILGVPIGGSVQNGDERGNGHADDSSLINGVKERNFRVVQVGEVENYDFRGVGTQTDGLSRTRYTKRSVTAKSSNMYKAMAEQRRQKQNGEDSPRPLGLQTVTLPKTMAVRPSSYHVANDVRGGPATHQSLQMPRSVRLPGSSKSTVNRPIEQVYQRPHTWSRRGTGDSRKRHILVVHSGKNSLRI